MKECKEGQGVDRYKLGLFSIWQRLGESLGIWEQPEIFSSPGLTKLQYDILSTSRLASEDVEYFGFGPTTPDCTGIGYAVHQDSCMFVFSAGEDRRDRQAAFKRNLNQALLDMAALMGE
jgi:carnitine O-acetyltransferase